MKFDIAFPKRTMRIEAPNEDRACEWGYKQAAQWGTPDLEFTVTDVRKAKAEAAAAAAKAEAESTQ
jgi:hypothetical protein